MTPEATISNGDTIEMINVRTGEVRELYRARNGRTAAWPRFIRARAKSSSSWVRERPTPDWQYGPFHRQGVIVTADTNAAISPVVNLDARDLSPPFTPGALRGGTHVHVWDAAGEWVSFTYEDHVLARFAQATPDHDINLRNVGVSVLLLHAGEPRTRSELALLDMGRPARAVQVSKNHPRNHDGEYFNRPRHPHNGASEAGIG